LSTSSLRHSTWTLVRGKPSRMTPSRYCGSSSRWNRRSITSRSPTMLPASLIRRASGESSSALITMGPQVRPRVLAMKRVLVPLPAPGAPPRRMISLGKRRRSSPTSRSSACQTAPKMICASLISRSVIRGVGAVGGTAAAWGGTSGAGLAGSVGMGCLTRTLRAGVPAGKLSVGTHQDEGGQIGRAISVGESPREHLVEAGPGGVAQATPPWLFWASASARNDSREP
jgi:hypothetical protein